MVLHDLLDGALRALLERQLAAVGVADVHNADHAKRKHGRDQRHFDDRRAAVVGEQADARAGSCDQPHYA